MSFRRAAKTDANQKEIIAAFRQFGWSVLIISQLKNCCDIMVSKKGQTVAVEIKDGSKPLSKQKLSEGEKRFQDEWQGEYRIITSVADVLRLNKELHSVKS